MSWRTWPLMDCGTASGGRSWTRGGTATLVAAAARTVDWRCPPPEDWPPGLQLMRQRDSSCPSPRRTAGTTVGASGAAGEGGWYRGHYRREEVPRCDWPSDDRFEMHPSRRGSCHRLPGGALEGDGREDVFISRILMGREKGG